MDGGFGEVVAVPESMLYQVPPGLTPREAALVEIYSIGFHACNRARITGGHMGGRPGRAEYSSGSPD